ncbi:hypothetical protein F4802DRAFT_524906 [Xylaria palmicola]|nr:hypothetical protein F4802DRAFT_524906 [Xylaria palmicola]
MKSGYSSPGFSQAVRASSRTRTRRAQGEGRGWRKKPTSRAGSPRASLSSSLVSVYALSTYLSTYSNSLAGMQALVDSKSEPTESSLHMPAVGCLRCGAMHFPYIHVDCATGAHVHARTVVVKLPDPFPHLSVARRRPLLSVRPPTTTNKSFERTPLSHYRLNPGK